MSNREVFQLRRQSDGLIYTFCRSPDGNGDIAYKREDGDFWITFRQGLGWVAWDSTTQSCTGRPWDVLPAAQGDFPPEGVWVSRKGARSYVYVLVYVTER